MNETQKKNHLMFNCPSALDKLPTYARFWLQRNLNEIPIEVPKRVNCMTASGKNAECHWNVNALVQIYGGSSLGGLAISVVNNAVYLTDHTVWITPEKKLVDVTFTSDDAKSSILLPMKQQTQYGLTSILLCSDYKRRGIYLDYQSDAVNQELASQCKLSTVIFQGKTYLIGPSSRFKKYMIFSLKADWTQVEKDALKRADFTLPSKFTGKYWSQIVQEKMSLQTQSH